MSLPVSVSLPFVMFFLLQGRVAVTNCVKYQSIVLQKSSNNGVHYNIVSHILFG